MDKRGKDKEKKKSSKSKASKNMCKQPGEVQASSSKGPPCSNEECVTNVVMRAQVKHVIGDLENMVGELKAVVGGMKSLVHQIDAVTSSIDEQNPPPGGANERARRFSEPGDSNSEGHVQKKNHPVFRLFQKPFPPKSAKESAAELFTAQTSFIPPPAENPMMSQSFSSKFCSKTADYANASMFCDKRPPAYRKLSPFQSNYPKMGVTAKLTYADDFTSTGSRDCISAHERSKQSLEAEAKRTGISMGKSSIGNKRPRSKVYGYSVPIPDEENEQPSDCPKAVNKDNAHKKRDKSTPKSKEAHRKKEARHSKKESSGADARSDLYESELDKQLENLKVSRCHFDTLDDSVYSYGATISSYGTMSKSLRDAYRKYRDSMKAFDQYSDTLESVPSVSCCAEGRSGCASSTMSSSIAGSYPLGHIESEITFKEELLRRSNEITK